MSVVPIKLVRVVRTQSSEVFVLWRGENRCGQLDLHYAHDVIHGNLLLEEDFSMEEQSELFIQIDQEIVSSYLPSFEREDFLLTVFRGEEVNNFSDGTDNEDDENFLDDLP